MVMRLIAHLSRWMDANGLGVTGLTREQVERYIGGAARRGPHLGAVAAQSRIRSWRCSPTRER